MVTHAMLPISLSEVYIYRGSEVDVARAELCATLCRI